MNTPGNSNTASRSEHAGGGVDWQARYLAGDTPWEKGAPHPALVGFLKTAALEGRVLVPGCGAGHDVRAIAAAGGARVVGMDIAPAALDAARAHAAGGGEQYVPGDFLAGDAKRHGPFDGIFEHTCFCAIPPPRRPDYLAAAAECLKAGGLLLGVFFLNPENPDPGSPPFPSRMDEILDLFGKEFDLQRSETAIATFPGREGREVLLSFRLRK